MLRIDVERPTKPFEPLVVRLPVVGEVADLGADVGIPRLPRQFHEQVPEAFERLRGRLTKREMLPGGVTVSRQTQRAAERVAQFRILGPQRHGTGEPLDRTSRITRCQLEAARDIERRHVVGHALDYHVELPARNVDIAEPHETVAASDGRHDVGGIDLEQRRPGREGLLEAESLRERLAQAAPRLDTLAITRDRTPVRGGRVVPFELDRVDEASEHVRPRVVGIVGLPRIEHALGVVEPDPREFRDDERPGDFGAVRPGVVEEIHPVSLHLRDLARLRLCQPLLTFELRHRPAPGVRGPKPPAHLRKILPAAGEPGRLEVHLGTAQARRGRDVEPAARCIVPPRVEQPAHTAERHLGQGDEHHRDGAAGDRDDPCGTSLGPPATSPRRHPLLRSASIMRGGATDKRGHRQASALAPPHAGRTTRAMIEHAPTGTSPRPDRDAPSGGMHAAPIERLVDLLDPDANVILNMTVAEAVERVGSGRPEAVRGIRGQFALVHRQGKRVRMARSIGRPLRYFIAKKASGPLLITADRIDAIAAFLDAEGLADQFHPSYTRMVPAHHVLELALVGCPDPNPICTRFFAPPRDRWPADLDGIGARYIGALAAELAAWLDAIGPREPIGVLFSGGIDSGALLLVLHHLLLERGEAPTRLKAFTLSVAADGADLRQAREFLRATGLELFLEAIEVSHDAIDVAAAVRTIEDYKRLDVEAAAATLALCRGIRERYPDWTWLVDGDGGDENLKDYPIEDNPELTIKSVLSNRMLYQEGWGIDAIKHSQTYSGGQSRGHVRTYAPGAALGFRGFSPYALPNVIEIAEGIPFIALTDWDHTRLYALKGEVVRRGVKAVTGRDMPIFAKRRLQAGITADAGSDGLFPHDAAIYRRMHQQFWDDRAKAVRS